MDFYHVLFAKKYGFNGRLTWYGNLFAKAVGGLKKLAKLLSIKGNTIVWNQLVNTSTTSVTLTSGHKFITKVSSTYSLVNGTGQSLSVTGGTDEVFDLTKMGLGSITSVQEFTALFPLPYYAYDSGSLLSFNGTGIKVVGFNQWDEQWEVGEINNSTGQSTTGTLVISKNFIPVFPKKTYYWNSPYGGTRFFYDADQRYISTVYPYAKTTFTVPDNAYYMKFKLPSVYGTTYNNDICINISSSKNGTYEPYTEETLSLPIATYFPNGMRSAGNAYDELTNSKAITRIGVVDLGSLTWSYLGGETALRFYATLPSDAVNVDASAVANAITSKYPVASWNSVAPNVSADKMFALTVTYITIRDTSYTDATAFKTAMSGVYLYYELATPTETDVDLDLSYNTYEGGTEQLLPVNESTPVTSPILADIQYPDGLRTNQMFTYRVYEEIETINNNALSIVLGKNVSSKDAKTALGIITKGE